PTWAKNTRQTDVFTLKTMIGEIGVILGLNLRLVKADPEYPLYSLLHPKRHAQVLLGDEVVGVIGEVHPRVVAAYKLKRTRPCYFELAANIVERQHSRPPYVEPPAHHPIVRSLAFTLPKGIPAIHIARHLKSSGPTWLDEVVITDQFDHVEDTKPVRTITFALTFVNPDFDLTADKTNAATGALIEAIHLQFGPQGVQLR
ncbi:MAG: hypothetical protein HN348_35195, partial [Proteobacteria bacterium]|nr:hypothetical protein [Pseudomonadota bacterium]